MYNTEVRVSLKIDSDDYWYWCSQNFKIGTWRKLVPLMGDTATYVFDNPEDATLFRIVHGV